MEENHVKKIIVITIALISLAVIGILFWTNKRQDAVYSKYAKSINQQLSELQRKKDTLEEELEAIQATEVVETVDGSTEAVTETVEAAETSETAASDQKVPVYCNLIFTSMDRSLYDDIGSAVSDSQVQKMFALGTKNYDSEALSVYLMIQMKHDDWTMCLYWDGTENAADWYNSILEKIKYENIDMPDIVYCKAGTYSNELGKQFAELGIKGIINHGETGDELPVPGTTDAGLWYIGSQNLSKADLSALADNRNHGRIYVYTVGNEDDYSYSDTDKQQISDLLADIAECNKDSQNPQVYLKPINDAVEQALKEKLEDEKQQEQEEQAVVEEEQQEKSRAEEIQEEISQLEKQMRELR